MVLAVKMTTETVPSFDEPVAIFPQDMIPKLLTAFSKSAAVTSEREEVTALRTAFYSEVLMYLRSVHPETLDVVDDIQSLMKRILPIKTISELAQQIEYFLERCVRYRHQLEVLVGKFAFVIGNLNNLAKRTVIEKADLELSVSEYLEKRRLTLKEAKILRIRVVLACPLPPLASKIERQANAKKDLAEEQQKGVDSLQAAVSAIEALYTCQCSLYQILDSIARTLVNMTSRLRLVRNSASDATNLQLPSATTDNSFLTLKEEALGVDWGCETISTTRLDFLAKMVEAGADRLLTSDFERDWIGRYQKIKPITQ